MSVLLKIPLPYKGVFDGGAISGDCTIPSSEQAGQSFYIYDDVIPREKFASSTQYV